jgi:hypothetical protein
MRGIGLELVLSTETLIPEENVVFLLKLYSTLLPRTMRNSGKVAQYGCRNCLNILVTEQLSFRYATDYGMFRFCIAHTEEDWRPGTEQYKFIEQCLSSVDRQKQPWLIFLAHRVLGYSSCSYYEEQGTFGEPMGRDTIEELLQKYRVDLAFYGHVHSYERTCPVYQVHISLPFASAQTVIMQIENFVSILYSVMYESI